MSALRPCPSCRRHIRHELLCPFCAASFGKGVLGAAALTAATLTLVSYDATPTRAQIEDDEPVRLTPQYGAPSDPTPPPPPPPREDVDAGKPLNRP
ncbi:MAG: hypothetical protein J0L92_30840 [Deltaproteobacteria bacterium]|nr:hypothetical protein [Deltaproteobacteria bacterium]